MYHDVMHIPCMHPPNAGPLHRVAVDDDWNICWCMSCCRRRRAGRSPPSLNSDAYVSQIDAYMCYKMTYMYLQNAVPANYLEVDVDCNTSG